MVAYGVRGIRGRRAKLSATRGVPYADGEGVLTGQRAVRFGWQAILAGSALLLRLGWFWIVAH
jgi:hypothetical protein